jgi:IS1 family transposase
MLDRSSIVGGMNKLNTEKRVAILSALVEGNSLRSTTRMTGVSINTVTKLLVDAGAVCEKYQDETLRSLTCERLQADEIWAFCHAKEKNVKPELKGVLGFGDVWTWVAIDADTKLVPTWVMGHRDVEHANAFMKDLASRLVNRVQLTTDGLHAYGEAVGLAFKGDVDYARLVKTYGTGPAENGRYSPPVCTGCKTSVVTGSPEAEHISTSYIERQNLTMRMGMRRFTRLTNGFSKKLENLGRAVALHFMHYNFARRHKTLKVSPAMAAGVSRTLWSIEDIVNLID